MKLIAKIKRRLRYHIFEAILCRGMPFPKAEWERQFDTGVWDFLESDDETARYLIIQAFIQRRQSADLSILDLGCGQGRLLRVLSQMPFSSYLGVDISESAISRARRNIRENSEFIVADIESWQPTDRYDVIIFNETLYYFQRPLKVVERYAEYLRAEGRIIISMVDKRNHQIMWKRIAGQFGLAHYWRVQNEKSHAWTVGLLEGVATVDHRDLINEEAATS